MTSERKPDDAGTVRSKKTAPKLWSQEEMRAAKALPLPTVPDDKATAPAAPERKAPNARKP